MKNKLIVALFAVFLVSNAYAMNALSSIAGSVVIGSVKMVGSGMLSGFSRVRKAMGVGLNLDSKKVAQLVSDDAIARAQKQAAIAAQGAREYKRKRQLRA